MSILITKIGGGLIDEAGFDDLLDRVAAGEGPRIVVHGGGPQATELARRLGVEPVRIEGRRVTDDATLEIATMVYAGLTNKKIVAGLVARGVPAIGLSGADADILGAVRRPINPIDFGHVGDIKPSDVDVDRLLDLLSSGLVPVLCALTHDRAGGLLNTNADTIAATVAIALAGRDDVTLEFVTHTAGLLTDPDDPASIIDRASADDIERMKDDGIIGTGMIPKVDNALTAARAGVRVMIGGTVIDGTPITERVSYPPHRDESPTPEPGSIPGAIVLLENLIRTPSLSGAEHDTADLIADYLESNGYPVERSGNNVWSRTPTFDPDRPTLLLNSHHDTVPPASDYTRSPYEPYRDGDRLYGLGSNDAGGPLVALLALYVRNGRNPDLPVNLLMTATAEEETSGENGIASILDLIGPVDFGIVGEPTSLDVAVAEKGLMVLDCTVSGVSGHAAREEGESALYRALPIIEWFRDYRFDRVSESLGPIKMSVTMIDSGTAHNVVPDRCRFVVDVRTTDVYTNDETLGIIRDTIARDFGDCTIIPRSTRLQPSGIASDHPLRVAFERCGLRTYGSPTLSDQSRIPIPTLKFGPGDSARSHTADEYIEVSEIEKGVEVLERVVGSL